MKKFMVCVVSILMLTFIVTGCGMGENAGNVETEASVKSEEIKGESKEVDEGNLKGHSLFIFCGAGMKDPFEEIAKEFGETTECDVQVTYANAAQIQTQIQTAKEGDFFIAGSMEEVKPVKEYVESSKELVKHIPVLAVNSKNPKKIHSIEDLKNKGVRLVVGDKEATPIGKIANKVLEDFSISDKVNIVSNTATAPAMLSALAAEEADAIIVWKENVDEKTVKIVNSEEMKSYIKTVPAVKLNTSKEKEAQKAFDEYLDGDTAKKIWLKYGYEIVK